MTLEDSTYSEKHFLSGIVENAAASVSSVQTQTEDGVLLFDASLTLVNAEGRGTTFAYGYVFDPQFPDRRGFNEHDSLVDLRDDVLELLAAVTEWGVVVLEALNDFMVASLEATTPAGP